MTPTNSGAPMSDVPALVDRLVAADLTSRIAPPTGAAPQDEADRPEQGRGLLPPDEKRPTMPDPDPDTEPAARPAAHDAAGQDTGTAATPDPTLDAHAATLARLDEAVVMAIVGVAQAAEDMQKAIADLDMLLDERRLQAAAALGYRDISSAFVFLQRTLGDLQGTDHDLSALISEVAPARRCAYEDAEPDVLARMENMRPRAEGDGDDMTARLKPHARLDLPEAVRTHLGIEVGARLRFEPRPDGEMEIVVEDRGRSARDILAELRGEEGQGSDGDDAAGGASDQL